MNYTTLKALALNYSNRSDTDVDSNMDNFILMAEAKINRKLRINESSVTATVPTEEDQEMYTLPTDFNGIRDIELRSDSTVYTMEYVSPVEMNYLSTKTNLSSYYYTIIAGQFQVQPPSSDGDTIAIVYFQKVPNLDGSTTTSNWVSDNYPDIYLAAIMVEIEAYVKNAAGVELWELRLNEAIDAIQMSDKDNRWSGTPLQVRTA